MKGSYGKSYVNGSDILIMAESPSRSWLCEWLASQLGPANLPTEYFLNLNKTTANNIWLWLLKS